MLIIGSRALNFYYPDRVPKDWDVICSREQMNLIAKNLKNEPVSNTPGKYLIKSEEHQIECELIEESHSGSIYYNDKVGRTGRSTSNLPGYPYGADLASADQLLSIKKSHIIYPRFWDKHIRDYHMLLGSLHFDRLPEITKMRRGEIEARLGKLKTPSLNQSKNNFFKDNVSNKTFIHDDIHLVMAHKEKPMYEYIKIDPDKVACSKDKFCELSIEERIQCVLEEAYVIALERHIVPMLFEGAEYKSTEWAFNWAVMRICTTLCSGWFRTFAIDNWPAIISSHDINYADKFMKAVENKQIVRI